MIDEKKFEFYEPDSSVWTWENFYNRTYRHMYYWKNLAKETKNGKYFEAEFCFGNNVITMGCDTIFHFTNDYSYLFRKMLGKEYAEKKYTDMNHSVLNFSLLPKEGALNNNKANGRYCDRVDRFVYYINELIKKNNDDNPLLKVRGNNKNTIGKLRKYLNSFSSIEDFCYSFYMIDANKTNLVSRLLKSGEKYINCEYTEETCREYLSIAEDFWQYRKRVFEDEFGLNIDSLDDKV